MGMVGLKDVLAAREVVKLCARVTPVLTCSEANKLTQRNVFFKAEHLQTTGSFKIRGATNAVSVTTNAIWTRHC